MKRRKTIANIVASAITGLVVAGVVALYGGPLWAVVGFGFVVHFVVLPARAKRTP